MKLIIANPPYFAGRENYTKNVEKDSHLRLNKRLLDTYIKNSTAKNKASLYDSYFKAYRWCTDQLGSDGGIIAFVSNGSWLNSVSGNGFRRVIEKEFTSIYIFNLRGNGRVSGDFCKKEGDVIFKAVSGSCGGSRVPVVIIFLVKNSAKQTERAQIYYHTIADYLDIKEKIKIISEFKTILNNSLNFKKLESDKYGDWFNKRTPVFESFIPIYIKNNPDKLYKSFFSICVPGVCTTRDAWVYNFSQKVLSSNIQKTIKYYQEELSHIILGNRQKPICDDTKGSWSRELLFKLLNRQFITVNPNAYCISNYRPFTKQYNYYDSDLINRKRIFNRLFPAANHGNLLICVGLNEYFPGISDSICDLHYNGYTHCFPLYYYENHNNSTEYVRKDVITDYILEESIKRYGEDITKIDIFYYVYGYLHNPLYLLEFANELKKELPRIQLVDNREEFFKYSNLGRALADLHLNYETVDPYNGVIVTGMDSNDFKIKNMKFTYKGRMDSITYNNKITISNIPLDAYEYKISGKSAIEWIMDRYKVSKHTKSGIINNPNDWCEEHNNPRYILDLLLSIINVSVKTVRLIKDTSF